MARIGNRSPASALVVLVVGALVVVPALVAGKGTYYTDWQGLYPASLSGSNMESGTGKSCQLCHEASNGGDGWNGYGWSMRQGILADKTPTQAMLDAQPLDSDADPGGFSNISEINSNTQPGWTTGSNTIYYKNGSTSPGSPPAGIGDLDPSQSAAPDPGGTPAAYALKRNWPNPHRASTTLAFDLPVADQVRLQIFDVQGRLLKTLLNETLGPGSYRITWHGDLDSGERAGSGLYFYRLDTPHYQQTRKAVRL